MSRAKKKIRKYRKNFLSQVIARIDFADSLDLPSKGPEEDVRDFFKKNFPVAERKVNIHKQVTFHLDGEPEEKKSEVREWHFFSKSRHKKLVLSDRFMLVEYSKYNTFDTLKTDFLSASNLLFDTYDNLQVERFGLRYVDKIELDEEDQTDWKKYLSSNLLSIFKLADEEEKIARAFHLLEILHDDESRLRFQYGMPNPDFPSRIKRKLFVLDWDLYCTLILDKPDVEKFLDIFHSRAKSAFEEVITDDLRNEMGVIYE